MAGFFLTGFAYIGFQLDLDVASLSKYHASVNATLAWPRVEAIVLFCIIGALAITCLVVGPIHASIDAKKSAGVISNLLVLSLPENQRNDLLLKNRGKIKEKNPVLTAARALGLNFDPPKAVSDGGDTEKTAESGESEKPGEKGSANH